LGENHSLPTDAGLVDFVRVFRFFVSQDVASSGYLMYDVLSGIKGFFNGSAVLGFPGQQAGLEYIEQMRTNHNEYPAG